MVNLHRPTLAALAAGARAPATLSVTRWHPRRGALMEVLACDQGLTLVHFLA